MARATQASRVPRRTRSGRLGIALAWELVLLTLVVIALFGGMLTWIICAAIGVVLIVLGIPWTGRSALTWLRDRMRFARRRRSRAQDPGDIPVDLVPLAQWVPGLQVNQTRSAQGAEVGVVTDGESWTAILSLTSDDQLLADQGEKIDLEALSGLTLQDDIRFAGLQVVSYTVPAPVSALLPEGSPAVGAYLDISAEVPPAVRRTWICVRLDPRLCLEAVARRGASTDGIYATLRFGLHRVQAALKRQGITTRALSPIEIYEVLSLTSGSTPDHGSDRSAERWRSWFCDGLVHTGTKIRSMRGNASLGYQNLLSALDRAPVLFAVTSYTLDDANRATVAVRLVTPNPATAQAAVSHLRRQLPRSVQLAPPGGLQVPTVLSTVPLGRQVA